MKARDIPVATKQTLVVVFVLEGRYCLIWAIVLLGPALLVGQTAVDQPRTEDSGPAALNRVDGAPDDPAATSSEDKERAKRHYRLYMVIAGVLIAFLFILLLLISVLRSGRFLRQRYKVGEKSPPTVYVDAWSQYHLEEGETGPEESASL